MPNNGRKRETVAAAIAAGSTLAFFRIAAGDGT
jgi:hypothetical protein